MRGHKEVRFLEELATGHRTIYDLGETEFHLPEF
jgi:hypothetical protein